jgi:hypothetical protein
MLANARHGLLEARLDDVLGRGRIADSRPNENQEPSPERREKFEAGGGLHLYPS